jgi:lipopolysaccharide export system permease protein
MNLIDRLILREVLKTLSLIIVILLVVLFANQIVRLLGEMATGALSGELLLSLTGYQMIRLLPRLLPAAFFFALLWVLAGMYRDNEMTALYSSGVSLARIYRAALTSALPICLLTAAFSLYWVPWANAGIQQIKQQPQTPDKISLIRPAEFNEYGEVIVYAASLSPEGTRLHQLFLQDHQQGQTGIVLADSARVHTAPDTSERYLILQQGRRYVGTPGQADYQLSTFAEYGLRLPVTEPGAAPRQIAAQPSSQLWQQDHLAARAEWQYRLSLPLAVLIFTLLAVPLARVAPRKDIYGRIALAILIYFVYLNLQRAAERWMEQAITPAWLGLWWVAASLAAIAGLLLCLHSAWLTQQRRRWRTRHADA